MLNCKVHGNKSDEIQARQYLEGGKCLWVVQRSEMLAGLRRVKKRVKKKVYLRAMCIAFG